MNRRLLLLPVLSLLVAPQTARSAADFWELDGNALTAADFLGSTNNFHVNFRSNNVVRMTIHAFHAAGDPTNGRVDIFSSLNLSTPTAGFTGDLFMPLGTWRGFVPPAGGAAQGDLSLRVGDLFLLADLDDDGFPDPGITGNVSLAQGNINMPRGRWNGTPGTVGEFNLNMELGDLFVEDGLVGVGFRAGDPGAAIHNPFFYDVVVRKNQIRIGKERHIVTPPSNEAALHIEAVGRYAGLGEGADHVVFIHSTAFDALSSPDGIAIKLDYTAGTSLTNDKNNFLTFYGGDSVALGAIEGFPTGNPPGVSFKSGGADFAEFLEKEDPADTFELGEIVGVSAGKISRVTQGADHILVVTRAPVVLGNAPQPAFEALWEKVAFLGQVPTLIVGPANHGDYILPSGLDDGTGIAVSPQDLQPGDLPLIVGTAWSSLEGGAPGYVNVALGFNAINWGAIIDREVQTKVDALTLRVAQLERLVGGRSTPTP